MNSVYWIIRISARSILIFLIYLYTHSIPQKLLLYITDTITFHICRFWTLSYSRTHSSPIFGPWKYQMQLICNYAYSPSKKKWPKKNMYIVIFSKKCSWDRTNPNKNSDREQKTLEFRCPLYPDYGFRGEYGHNDQHSCPKEPRVYSKCWSQMSCKAVKTYSWFRGFLRGGIQNILEKLYPS